MNNLKINTPSKMDQTVHFKNSNVPMEDCTIKFSSDEEVNIKKYNVLRIKILIQKYYSIKLVLIILGIIGTLVLFTSFFVGYSESPHHSKLFISDANQFRIYDLKTNSSSLRHEVTENIITFDVSDSSLFYIEKNLFMVQSIPRSIHGSRFLNSVTLTTKIQPQAMAVDFLTKKLYLIDKSVGAVNVMDFEGKNFGIILSDLEELHDIVLDLEEGLMFIVQYKKSILRVNMDGTNLQKIVKNKNVTAMALDRKGKKIFWADGDAGITVANYDGKNRIVLMEPQETIITSLSFHENNLFWLHPLGHSKRVTPWTCRIEKEICKHKKDLPMLLYDPQIIKAYTDLSLTKNPCEINNGDCSDLCLLTSNKKRTCACKTGYQLDSDLQNCIPVDDFIIYITKNHVRGISANSNQNDTFKDVLIPMRFTPNLIGDDTFYFDYDVENDDFYFCEDIFVKTFKIKSESEPRILFFARNGCRGLTYDWLSKNFYYISNNYLKLSRRISYFYLSDEKEIENTNGTNYFTIDVKKGGIYFMNDLKDFYLHFMNTDGSSFKTLTSGNSIENYTSLVLDFEKSTVHFSDGHFFYSKELIYPTYSNKVSCDLLNIKSISVHKEYIYGHNSTSIWRFNKNDRLGKVLDVREIVSINEKETIIGMKVFSTTEYNDVYNQCADQNGGCEQFCFSKPIKTCGCMTGYSLSYNRCSRPHSYSTYFGWNSN